MRSFRRLRVVSLPLVAMAALATLAACTSAPSGSESTSSPPPTTSTSPSPSPSSSTLDRAQQLLAQMSLAQKVGQLLMVDCPSTGVAQQTLTDITQYHVGGVILDGNSDLSVQATAAITAQLQQAAPANVKLLISTDQEGGLVQRLRGPGFATIPTAVSQGQLPPAELQQDATTWNKQLKDAGVTENLAPVLGTVPPGVQNPPIGELDRNYGTTPQAVATHGMAVLAGMKAAGVIATAKHFPGLGLVSGNTDTTSGVTDDTITADSPYIQPFADAIKAGVPVMMMSSAIYAKIDPSSPAPFSHEMVTGLLREKYGFNGVIMSDDLGAAKQVAYLPVGQRAVDFIAAGGDIVLTVVASQAQAMTEALIAKAEANQGFAQVVDAATLRVLRLKLSHGLLP